MKFEKIPKLTTERLTLRKLKLTDIPLYYEKLASQEEISQYMLWEPHKDMNETIEYITKEVESYEKQVNYKWAITQKGENDIIGVIALLRFDEKENSCSFAYMLAKEHWNKGYVTEALKRVMEFAFLELGVERIEVDHLADNVASGKVMQKVGMEWIGIQKDKYTKPKGTFDAVCYEITKDRFLTNK